MEAVRCPDCGYDFATHLKEDELKTCPDCDYIFLESGV